MLNVFRSKPRYATVKQSEIATRTDFPDDLWTRCDGCGKLIYNKVLAKDDFLCATCGYHFRLSAVQRLTKLVSADDFEPFPALVSQNALDFPGYPERIKQAQRQTGLDDAILIGKAKIQSSPCVLGIIDFSFIGGSMGSVVGEQIARGFEYAIEHRLPVAIFSGGGGGARMQEGIFSLMQMAKTAQAVGKHSREGLLYISVLTHPTMGGVYASFASLGDVILAEPGALIGFAGPRIVEETTGQKLPADFQTAEVALAHGMIDAIVPRYQLVDYVGRLLKWHQE